MSVESETVMTEAEFNFLLDQLKTAQADSEYWESRYKEEASKNIELEKENIDLRMQLMAARTTYLQNHMENVLEEVSR